MPVRKLAFKPQQACSFQCYFWACGCDTQLPPGEPSPNDRSLVSTTVPGLFIIWSQHIWLRLYIRGWDLNNHSCSIFHPYLVKKNTHKIGMGRISKHSKGKYKPQGKCWDSNRGSSFYKRRRQWQPTPVLLPGKCHGQRSLVGCSSWGR